MKKILFYLIIAFAIFSPNSLCAHDTGLQSGGKIAERECAFDDGQSNNDNLFFDVCFEDLSEDDSNDSERKKPFFEQKAHFDTRFISQSIFDNTFKKVFPPKFLFLRKIPLFVFISVFRL